MIQQLKNGGKTMCQSYDAISLTVLPDARTSAVLHVPGALRVNRQGSGVPWQFPQSMRRTRPGDAEHES